MEQVFQIGIGFFEFGALIFVLTAIVYFIGAKIIKKILLRALSKLKINHESKFLQKCLIALVYAFLIYSLAMQITPLQNMGSALLGASGVVAVVLGFAAQESMSNFVGGLFIAVYQPFQIGDRIILKDKDVAGTVTDIGFRHCVITTLENTRLVIPNSIMNNSIIENRENSYSRQFFSVGISYDSDVDQAIACIQRCASQIEELIDERSEQQIQEGQPIIPVVVSDLKDYSIELKATIAGKDPGAVYAIACRLRKDILREFKKEGIKIPFPTTEVQLAQEKQESK